MSGVMDELLIRDHLGNLLDVMLLDPSVRAMTSEAGFKLNGVAPALHEFLFRPQRHLLVLLDLINGGCLTEIFNLLWRLLIYGLIIKLFDYTLPAFILPESTLCTTHLAVRPFRGEHAVDLILGVGLLRRTIFDAIVIGWLPMILVHVSIVIREILMLLLELSLSELD